MKTHVVDASVAVKWFVEEIQSDDAERLLDRDFHLWAPDLIGAEITNTLWKKVRRHELSVADAVEIQSAFASVAVEIAPSAPLLPAALQIAVSLDRSVYDSLYLALAVALDCTLVTADRKFYAAIAASRLASHIMWVGDKAASRPPVN